jgi:hypothetical protein
LLAVIVLPVKLTLAVSRQSMARLALDTELAPSAIPSLRVTVPILTPRSTMPVRVFWRRPRRVSPVMLDAMLYIGGQKAVRCRRELRAEQARGMEGQNRTNRAASGTGEFQFLELLHFFFSVSVGGLALNSRTNSAAGTRVLGLSFSLCA